VFGVAGSGKTVILIARAKLISRLNPSARVLVLCFNVPLKRHAGRRVEKLFDRNGFSFRRLGQSNGVVRDNDHFQDHARYGTKLLDALEKGSPDASGLTLF